MRYWQKMYLIVLFVDIVASSLVYSSDLTLTMSSGPHGTEVFLSSNAISLGNYAMGTASLGCSMYDMDAPSRCVVAAELGFRAMLGDLYVVFGDVQNMKRLWLLMDPARFPLPSIEASWNVPLVCQPVAIGTEFASGEGFALSRDSTQSNGSLLLFSLSPILTLRNSLVLGAGAGVSLGNGYVIAGIATCTSDSLKSPEFPLMVAWDRLPLHGGIIGNIGGGCKVDLAYLQKQRIFVEIDTNLWCAIDRSLGSGLLSHVSAKVSFGSCVFSWERQHLPRVFTPLESVGISSDAKVGSRIRWRIDIDTYPWSAWSETHEEIERPPVYCDMNQRRKVSIQSGLHWECQNVVSLMVESACTVSWQSNGVAIVRQIASMASKFVAEGIELKVEPSMEWDEKSLGMGLELQISIKQPIKANLAVCLARKGLLFSGSCTWEHGPFKGVISIDQERKVSLSFTTRL